MRNLHLFDPVLEWLDGGAQHTAGFNMAEVVTEDPECGTVCCIAGALAIFNGFPRHHWHLSDVEEALGLTDKQSDQLFCLTNSNLSYDEISPFRAAATIRHFIKTEGEVVWTAS